MLTYIRGFISFKKDERAVTAVEYALIAAFIAAALLVALPKVTKALNTSFGTLQTMSENAGTAGTNSNTQK